jgi:hypothetical protein
VLLPAQPCDQRIASEPGFRQDNLPDESRILLIGRAQQAGQAGQQRRCLLLWNDDLEQYSAMRLVGQHPLHFLEARQGVLDIAAIDRIRGTLQM